MASACARMSWSFIEAIRMYQELQPIGGVRANWFPMTIRNFRSQLPSEFLALRTTVVVPGVFTAPAMMPVARSSLRPCGRPEAKNCIGRLPVAGILYRKG